MSEHRQEFERFISSPPFEKDIERFPTDASKYSWPGAYCDITVELAWECWREATSVQIARFESQLAVAEERNIVPNTYVTEVHVCSKETQISRGGDTENLAEGTHVSNRRLKELESALRWACNVYMVADGWQGQERENWLQKAMNCAIREGLLQEGESDE